MKVFTNFIPDEGVDYVHASEYTIVLQRHEFEVLREVLEFSKDAVSQDNQDASTIRQMIEALEGW